MKKCFYLAVFSLMIAACGQTPEQKAESLIKESLKKSLYKPETYKPIETKVDSAFAPYDDPAFFDELEKLGKMSREIDVLEHQAKRAKSSMALWSGPYQTAFDREKYQEAKDEFDEADAKIEKLRSRVKKTFDKILSTLQEGPKFIGFKAFHSYRANSNAGNTLIGNMVFFIDKEFEQITYKMELEEYNQIQDALMQLEEEIDTEEYEY